MWVCVYVLVCVFFSKWQLATMKTKDPLECLHHVVEITCMWSVLGDVCVGAMLETVVCCMQKDCEDHSIININFQTSYYQLSQQHKSNL